MKKTLKAKNERKYLLIALLITSLLVLVGLLLNKQAISIKQSAPTNSQSDPIADWKTYTNAEFGYEIKYPTNYKVEKLGAVQCLESYVTLSREDSEERLFVWVWGGLPKNNIENVLSMYKEGSRGCIVTARPEASRAITTVVSGKASKVFFTEICDEKTNNCSKSTHYLVESSTHVYEIIEEYNRNIDTENIIILDQILSTFRFIDPPKP